MNSDDLGGYNAIYNVWVDLGQQVFKGPKDTSILEPSTSLMRAALEHLKTEMELFNQMTQNDLEVFYNLHIRILNSITLKKKTLYFLAYVRWSKKLQYARNSR